MPPQQLRTEALIVQAVPLPVPARHDSTDLIVAVVGVFGTATLGAIGWVFRSLVANYNDRFRKIDASLSSLSQRLELELKAIERKIEDSDRKLLEHRLEVQRTYVERDQFVVAAAKIDTTVQGLREQVYQNGIILESLKERLRERT